MSGTDGRLVLNAAETSRSVIGSPFTVAAMKSGESAPRASVKEGKQAIKPVKPINGVRAIRGRIGVSDQNETDPKKARGMGSYSEGEESLQHEPGLPETGNYQAESDNTPARHEPTDVTGGPIPTPSLPGLCPKETCS